MIAGDFGEVFGPAAPAGWVCAGESWTRTPEIRTTFQQRPPQARAVCSPCTVAFCLGVWRIEAKSKSLTRF